MTGVRNSGSLYKWYVVAALWFVCLLNYADRQAIFSVFPLLKTELRLTDMQLGFLGASFMWVYALFGPLAGWLCDRLARKTLILGALVFWSLVTAASAETHSFAGLVACRALSGLGEAVYLPAAMSLIGDYHDSRTRSRAMSIHQSSVYVGTVMGGGMAGWIAQHYGWRTGFLFFGALGISLGAILLKVLREPERGQSEENAAHGNSTVPEASGIWSGVREVFSKRSVLLLIAVFMGANFVAVVFLSWMPSFLYRKFHMSLSMAGFNGTAYLQAASVLGVLSGGIVADAMARRKEAAVNGRVFTQSMGLICGVPFLFLTGYTSTVAILFASMLAFGYCKGMYDSNIFASLYDLVSVEHRGVAAGIFNSLGWLGGGMAPVLVAMFAERYGMGPCISGTAAIYLVIGLLLLWSSRRPGFRHTA